MTTHKNLRRAVLMTLALGMLVFVAGCRKEHGHHHHDHAGHHDHAHHGHDHGELADGARFVEGRGIVMKPETAAALGLKIAAVEERTLQFARSVSVQVIQTAPEVRALLTLPRREADRIIGREIPGARLIGVDKQAEEATGLVDLLFVLDGRAGARVGEVLTLSIPFTSSEPAVVVPASAVLSTASGVFVYVVNGDALLRTTVETGAKSASEVEISSGLYAGDEVAIHPVEQLWLIELRATKGGGHSH